MTEPAARRLDVALVAAGLFESRARAQEAVAAGLVRIDGRPAARASERVGVAVRLQAEPPHPWVSRGGLKLVAALDRFGFDPAGQVCLDVGASTGGFTDVLLSRGAAFVHSVDVGHNQLHPRLRADARVSDRQDTDVRHVDALSPPPTLVVCDASFISLTLLLPAMNCLAASGADLVLLVKPQFEVGRGNTRKGIVRDAALREAACERVAATLRDLGWALLGTERSPVTGRDGNVEILMGARRP